MGMTLDEVFSVDQAEEIGHQQLEGEAELSQGVTGQSGEETASPAEEQAKPVEGQEGAEETEDAEETDGKTRQVPLAAVQSERKKRQKLEQELAEARGQIQALSQMRPQPASENESKPEDWESGFYKDPRPAIDQVVEQRVGSVESRVLAVAEDIMRSVHPDFDEAAEAFAEAAKQDQVLLQKFRASPNPARFAYDYGKAIKEAGQYGSLDAYKKSIEQKIRAELEEKYRKQSALQAAATVPKSNAGARGTGAEAAQAFAGPTPLSEILK